MPASARERRWCSRVRRRWPPAAGRCRSTRSTRLGSDLYWQQGLDFFGAYGLALILVSHWNNGDGGAVLDTSRCYLGEPRFQALLDLVPGGSRRYTIVGIDENTALAIDPQQGMCTVVGTGTRYHPSAGNDKCLCGGRAVCGQRNWGTFNLPARDGRHRRRGVAGSAAGASRMAQRRRAAVPQPDAEVQALLSAREQARAARNWQESDRLRDEIERAWVARAGYRQRAARGAGAVAPPNAFGAGPTRRGRWRGGWPAGRSGHAGPAWRRRAAPRARRADQRGCAGRGRRGSRRRRRR